jgi:hypothetical protein
LLKGYEKSRPAADFVDETREINEELMEAQVDEQPETLTNLHSKLGRHQTERYEPVKEILERYQEGIITEKELLQVKDYYLKKIVEPYSAAINRKTVILQPQKESSYVEQQFLLQLIYFKKSKLYRPGWRNW